MSLNNVISAVALAALSFAAAAQTTVVISGSTSSSVTSSIYGTGSARAISGSSVRTGQLPQVFSATNVIGTGTASATAKAVTPTSTVTSTSTTTRLTNDVVTNNFSGIRNSIR